MDLSSSYFNNNIEINSYKWRLIGKYKLAMFDWLSSPSQARLNAWVQSQAQF